MSLPFVPENDVPFAIEYLFGVSKPSIRGLSNFINYFKKTWWNGN